MAAVLFHEPIFATLVESGDKLYFYEAGTTTDLTVYLDAGLSATATQPVVADAGGRFPALYFDPTSANPKVILADADEVQKWALDEYPIEDTASIQQDLDQAELDIEDVEGRLATAESDIDTLQTESADYEDRLQTLETVAPSVAGSGARVRRSSSQSASAGVETTVAFDTTDYNDNSIAVSNVLTVPAGVTRVVVTAGGKFTLSANGTHVVNIRKNNSAFNGAPQENRLHHNTPYTAGITLTTGILNVTAGDTFQLTYNPGFSGTIESGAWMNLQVIA